MSPSRRQDYTPVSPLRRRHLLLKGREARSEAARLASRLREAEHEARHREFDRTGRRAITSFLITFGVGIALLILLLDR